VSNDELRQCRSSLSKDGKVHRCVLQVTNATYHAQHHTDGEGFHWPQQASSGMFADAIQAPASESQVGGDHYRKFKIQPWDIIDEYDLTFYEGSALKYLLRRKTDRLEDLKKCRHYLDKLIELEEGEL
jgi:hypothetical protein